MSIMEIVYRGKAHGMINHIPDEGHDFTTDFGGQ